VTHVYAKQTYRGLDVADGDVNINVKDGSIISYGNEVSFGLILAKKVFIGDASSVLQP
jgi:extracellular elastinolytic metalloproteinase